MPLYPQAYKGNLTQVLVKAVIPLFLCSDPFKFLIRSHGSTMVHEKIKDYLLPL